MSFTNDNMTAPRPNFRQNLTTVTHPAKEAFAEFFNPNATKRQNIYVRDSERPCLNILGDLVQQGNTDVIFAIRQWKLKEISKM